MPIYAFAVTVHDPEERLLKRFSLGLSQLASLYGQKTASCSRQTSLRTIKALKRANFLTSICLSWNEVGTSCRNAVQAVLETKSAKWIQYADLDRLLHWYYSYPQELKSILAKKFFIPYTAFGRTKRAWKTHPQLQIKQEKRTSAAFNRIVKTDKTCDWTSGSCLITRAAAETILKYSVEPTNATDLEWPAIIYRYMHITPQCILTEGLEFETADYYQKEINLFGSREAWIKSVYEGPKQIKARQKIAQDSIAAAKRVLQKDRG